MVCELKTEQYFKFPEHFLWTAKLCEIEPILQEP